MQINTAKQKMLDGKPAFGYSLGLGSPLAAEAMARTGVDFLLVETQHGSWGHDSWTAALMAISGSPAVPMARVAGNSYTLIGQMLDQGSMGIIIPMVDTPDHAKAGADACRLPPRGNRSWGVGRARIYGDDYLLWADEQVFVAVQIESAEAVKNAEAIMATPGVDGCWIGPNDLGLSMGIHPRDIPTSDEHARALEQVVQACRNTGKIPGLSCSSPEEARRRVDEGYLFLTAGADIGFMLAGARAGIKTMGL
ncbi:MAG TPA: aldolase/citrate lyase family protein [Chloroflexota bacterium]|nr:aldolase/citrate lyase family protein [Chloroflexota bacterium]